MWSLTKNTTKTLHPSLVDVWDWPNTITYFIALRMKYDSFTELPEVPPEEYWDYPILIQRHIEQLYPHIKKKGPPVNLEVDLEELEG